MTTGAYFPSSKRNYMETLQELQDEEQEQLELQGEDHESLQALKRQRVLDTRHNGGAVKVMSDTKDLRGKVWKSYSMGTVHGLDKSSESIATYTRQLEEYVRAELPRTKVGEAKAMLRTLHRCEVKTMAMESREEGKRRKRVAARRGVSIEDTEVETNVSFVLVVRCTRVAKASQQVKARASLQEQENGNENAEEMGEDEKLFTSYSTLHAVLLEAHDSESPVLLVHGAAWMGSILTKWLASSFDVMINRLRVPSWKLFALSCAWALDAAARAGDADALELHFAPPESVKHIDSVTIRVPVSNVKRLHARVLVAMGEERWSEEEIAAEVMAALSQQVARWTHLDLSKLVLNGLRSHWAWANSKGELKFKEVDDLERVMGVVRTVGQSNQ